MIEWEIEAQLFLNPTEFDIAMDAFKLQIWTKQAQFLSNSPSNLLKNTSGRWIDQEKWILFEEFSRKIWEKNLIVLI